MGNKKANSVETDCHEKSPSASIHEKTVQDCCQTEVETNNGEVPEKLTMDMLTAFGDAFHCGEGAEKGASDKGKIVREEVDNIVSVPRYKSEYKEPTILRPYDSSPKSPSNSKTCVLYTRMSSFCDSPSLEQQERLLQAKAEKSGFVVIEKFRVDNRRPRPDSFSLLRMKQYMEDHGVNTVFVKSYDEISDDAFMCKEIVDRLSKSGIEIIPIQECKLRVSAKEFFQMS